MRWSDLYVPTLRDDPAGADAVSHRLLLRAGFIRQLMAGHYSLLPLAVRVRTKVMKIVREEMERIGAQEFMLPAMHPAEVWQRSGRWEVMGEEMFRLTDRKGARLALGMTHEEIFATLAQELRSYRDLPQIWYQFQTKFRDEPRPKSGLIRVREFTMKDSYSFDLDPAGLDRSFDLHDEAYRHIFARLGIPAIAVQASSGSMGGSASVEFMCPSDAGEDLVVSCQACGYAANTEKATSRLSEITDGVGLAQPQRFDTPGVTTIEDLVVKHDVAADRQIKTLVYVADDELMLVLMRGDHALVEQKLLDVTGAVALRPAHPGEIRQALGASPGSLGAVGVQASLRVVADEALRDRRDMATGANTDGVHVRGVDIARDITVGLWTDLREATSGEPCISCGAPLTVVQAIEIGHIFKLGYQYTESLDVSVLAPDGTRVHPIMGSFGIGVERAIAAIVESHHDELGIVWPVQVAPFEVVVVPVSGDDEARKTAESIYDQLVTRRIDAVLDDRDERPGVKFRDAELVGIPYRVTVGGKGMARGVAEVTDREARETTDVDLNAVVDHISQLVLPSPS